MAHTIKTVVFDLDGTLIDTAPDIKAALDASIAPLGLKPLEPSMVKLLVGQGARSLIQGTFHMARRIPTETELARTLELFLDHYEDNIADFSQPFPGIIECLDWLLKNDFRLAVCTNKFEHLARKLLHQLDLLSYFHALTGGDTLSVRKPDAKHLRYTIEIAGGKRSRALMIGDSATDVQTAKNAKIPIIVVGWGYSQTAPSTLGGDILVNADSDLMPAVQKLMK